MVEEGAVAGIAATVVMVHSANSLSLFEKY